jgi:hypothetical protein
MLARALHLIDPPECAWPALEILAPLLHQPDTRLRHEPIIVGGTNAHARARRHGVNARDRFTPPLGKPLLGSRTLRRILDARPAQDLIVPWSVRTTLLAARAAPHLPVVPVLTLPPPPVGRAVRWTPFARHLRQSTLVVYPSAFLRDSWVARFTLLGCPSAVIPLTLPASSSARRDELRAQWGASDDTIVITPLGEPEEAVDAHAAVFAAGVLGVAGRAALVVVPPRAARLDRALRFAARIRPARRVIVDERPIPEILDAVDLVLWSEPPGEPSRPRRSVYTTPLGGVSLAFAAARNIPIVAHEHPAWRSVLGSYPRAIAVDDRTRLELTHAILRALNAQPSPVLRHPEGLKVNSPGQSESSSAAPGPRADSPPVHPETVQPSPSQTTHPWVASFESHILNILRPAPLLLSRSG